MGRDRLIRRVRHGVADALDRVAWALGAPRPVPKPPDPEPCNYCKWRDRPWSPECEVVKRAMG